MTALMQHQQQGADVDFLPHWPESRHHRPDRRRHLAQNVLGQRGAARRRSQAARAASIRWRTRRFASIRSAGSAEPPWPLASHPPKACVCRWAPDTETRIPAEPAPWGMLTGPGDELPDAPSSSAFTI